MINFRPFVDTKTISKIVIRETSCYNFRKVVIAVKDKKNNKSFWLLIFLSLFGLSIGVFDNYRDLWMTTNEITTLTISHIKSISNVVTVLALFYFTIKVPTDKLKKGMTGVLILKMITEVLLILLNGTGRFFVIKFLMFFDIAFTQLILSSAYPLMMNFAKDDKLYTMKSFAESFFDKMGFLLASILVGKVLFGRVIDYNVCLMACLMFTFFSFAVLLSIKIDGKSEESSLDVKNSLAYFKDNKVLILYLIVNFLGSVIWAIILGMPMLTLTENLGFNPQVASFLILGLGIVSNVFSIVVLKYLRFENDHINLIFKFGLRVIIYIVAAITNNPLFLIIAIIYLLITNSTHNFIFGSYFVNKIDEKYSLVLTTLKYCTSLGGDAVGILICGLVFDLSITWMTLPAAVLGVIHYILASILVARKKSFGEQN